MKKRREDVVKEIFQTPEDWVDCCGYLVKILFAVLEGKTAPPLPEGRTWEQVFEMSKHHGVESMAFAGVQELLEKDGNLYREWEKRYAENLVQCFTQEEELKKIVQELTASGIDVLLLKGCLIRDLYPERDYRQMVDMDMLIREKDRAAAGEVMRRMGESLSAADRQDLTFEMRTSGFAACRIDLAQLNNDCYYDYYLLPAPAVASEEDIYYNRAAFSWTLPDAEAFPRAGFRVERYCGEVLEQTYIYDNAYASSLSETTLKQNTEYTYRVTAYEEVDSVLNAVACYRVAFQYRPLTIRTLQGHFWYFIVAMIVLLAVLAAVILGYVYYYDIKKKLKKRT